MNWISNVVPPKIRSFLRRELKLAAEELAARGTPAPAPA